MMPTTTRDTVDALLPPGVTVDDLSDRQLGELFHAVVERTQGPDGDPPLDGSAAPAE